MRTIPIFIASALALAGCLDAAPDELDAASTTTTADGLAADGALATIPFSAEGNTYNGIFACAATACHGTDLPTTASGTSWFQPDISGILVAAELTLTWTAASPLTNELVLGIAYENEDGEPDWTYAAGTSPLVLSESGLDLPASKVNAVYVNPYKCQSAGPAPLATCYGAEQAFTIEGTLTTAAPPTETATTQT